MTFLEHEDLMEMFLQPIKQKISMMIFIKNYKKKDKLDKHLRNI